VNRECTLAEEAEFFDIVRDVRHRDKLESLMGELWGDAPETPLGSARSQDILQKILAPDRQIIPIRKRGFSLPARRIAASFAFITVCTAATLFYIGNNNIPNRDTINAIDERPRPGVIQLPDGSTVILNAGSTLEYPQSFDGPEREVTLRGEGFFDIQHDAEKPFVVHTGKVKTTVLGTAFNIKAYPYQSDITVTVTRGKVRVSDDKQIFGIVSPDQQITFNKNQELVQQKAVDSHEITSWVEKDIYFEDITIDQAINQLEKRFGITIDLKNHNIGSCKFTATFVREEDIEQILRILCDFNNATLLKKGSKEFEIHGGECPL
jgi:ferric-dicitrate binding protein FerR (iron transport regulator)